MPERISAGLCHSGFECYVLSELLRVLEFDRRNRENGGAYDALKPIIDELASYGAEWKMSTTGQKLGKSAALPDDGWATPTEAAKALDMNVKGVHRAREAGHLEGRPFGKRTWQISGASIAAYREQRQARKGA